MSWFRREATRLDESEYLGISLWPTVAYDPRDLQENNSVTELREKIKTFLASQGMIKGHSGSGPRSTEGDPPVLVLVENLQTTPPGNATPPTPTLSAGSNEPARQQQGPVSYIRDPSQYHHAPSIPPPDQHQQHQYAPPSQQQQQTSMYPSMFSYNPIGSNFPQPGLPIYQN